MWYYMNQKNRNLWKWRTDYEKIKTGILLIILGNLLYLAYIYFCRNEISDFGNFSSGLLQFNVNV